MTSINKKNGPLPVLELAAKNELQATAKQYVRPTVLTHSGEDLLDELGPAQACYPFSSCGVSP